MPPTVCAPATDILLKLSVKFTPVSAMPLLLLNVKVIVLAVTPSLGIAVGENAFAIVGEPPTTVRLAVLEPAALATASGPVNEIGDVAFGNTPGMLLVTNNEMVQVPLATDGMAKEIAPVC